MLDVSTVLTAFVVCFAGVMSPGPNFVAVTHRAVTASRPEALALVVGIVIVNALWAAAALFGLGMLFTLFPWMFWTVKILGAVYLVWFGIQLLRHSGQPLPVKPVGIGRSTFARGFCDGVIINLSNPKSMAFYASVFSAAVPAGAAFGALLVMVAMVGVVAALWYGGVALVLSSEQAAGIYRKGKPAIERVCGVFLIAFGLRHVLSR